MGSAQFGCGKIVSGCVESMVLKYDGNSIPEKYQEHVVRFLLNAEEHVSAGGKIPIAFLAGKLNDETDHIHGCKDSAQQTIDVTVAQVRAHARKFSLDYVISQMQVVTLPVMDRDRVLHILEQYGSISAYPQKITVVYFQLETKEDLYLATVPLVPRGSSATQKMFGDVVWRVAHTAEGAYKRFGGLLLPRAHAS
nr:hypothetical protein [uncultured Albidiferax sp.]